MHRRKLTVLALAAVAVAAVGLTGASGATGQLGRFHMIAGGTVSGSSLSSLALSNKPVTYILEMSAKPVAAVDAARKAAGRSGLSSAQRIALARQIRSQQAPVIAAVKQLRGAFVNTRFQGVYNGISVTLPQREAWRLGSLSGVKAVYATHQFKMDTAPGDGIPLVQGPQAWGGTPGFTGAGMKIADIDTGIDYTHADFGGTGTTTAYNCAHAHSTDDATTFATDCPGVSNWYSGAKIKGGTDLVGDNYNAAGSGSQLIPVPDDNPLDCNGHGTHTAGTAAGFGVDHNGNTYLNGAGPYNANTINNESFIIPPGVAPQADLYAVRVFGCSGSVNDDVLIEAMDWAFNHGMDVVNMSLGASFGSPSDPDSVAADNLAQEGVITVLSSGNSGPNPYITGSPAAGLGALAVAANDSTQSFPGADLSLSTGNNTMTGSNGAIVANGVTVTPGTYSLHVVHTDTGVTFSLSNISRGCSMADDEAENGGNPWPANTILVVKRGTCARVAKAIYAQQAGAAGVISVNNSSAFPPYEGPITSNPDNGSAYTVTIPLFGVKGASNPNTSANGAALLAADGGTVTVAANSGIVNAGYLGLASFTSWGPSNGGTMKPEVTAPGVSIISAGNGTGNGGIFLSGTSMAAPHTTGAAALVKQAHLDWEGDCAACAVRYYKDALVNTANTANVTGYKIRGAGAGEIDAYKATHTKVVADGSTAADASYDGSTAVNCDLVYTNHKVDCHGTITVTNFSNSKQVFKVSNSSPQGVAHSLHLFSGNSFSPLTVVVKANSTTTVSFELIVLQKNVPDAVSEFGDWWGSGAFDEASGLVHFKPVSGSNHGIALNVPYYAVPTEISNVAVSGISSSTLASGATADVTVTNPNGGFGYADYFSWGGSSPVSGTDIGSADLLADGVQSFPDGTGTADSASIVEFALGTTSRWSNPAEDIAEIDVDVNHDGAPDYFVYSYDHGALTAGSVDGEAITVVCPNVGSCVFHYLAGDMFNGSTMELPVQFADLCMASNPCVTSGTPITYSTIMNDRNGGVDTIPAEGAGCASAPVGTVCNKSFDIFHPSLSNNGEDAVGRNNVVHDPTTINPSFWNANPQLGVLVVMQNNQDDAREIKTFSLHF